MWKAISPLVCSALFFLAVPLLAVQPFVITGDRLHPRQPQLAVSNDNVVHLVFGSENRIYHCTSADEGRTFGEPILVGGLKSLSLGMRRGPRVAMTEKAVVVTAIGGEKGGGRDGDLWAWRSNDKGKSWSGPIQVNDVTSSAREGLHGMAAGPNGDLFCVWLDLRNKGTQIFGSRSTDGGATWSANSLVYKSPGGSVCECCHPSVVYDDQDGLHVMWRNSLDGNRDMYWTTSKDGGRTFAEAARLGNGSWKLNACPMDGGAIAVNSKGEIAAVWRRDKEIFATAIEPSNEQKLGAGVQPWVAANKRGVYSVWIADRPGELFLAVSGESRPFKLASGARDPVVAAAAQGPAVAAWETEENGRVVIHVTSIPRDLTKSD
jgi:BNR repeat-like domain